MSLESKTSIAIVTTNSESAQPATVCERITRIRRALPAVEGQSNPPRMDTTFSKESAPLFEKSFNQIYNQWKQDSKK